MALNISFIIFYLWSTIHITIFHNTIAPEFILLGKNASFLVLIIVMETRIFIRLNSFYI